jgi:hypothetical protein
MLGVIRMGLERGMGNILLTIRRFLMGIGRMTCPGKIEVPPMRMEW